MKFPMFGGTNDNPGASTAYTHLVTTRITSWNATENLRQIPLTTAVVITEFSITLTTAPGVGKTRTFIVRKNGANTEISITISGTDTTGKWQGIATFADGDLVGLQSTQTGTAAAPGDHHWWMWMTTVGQKALVMGSNIVAPSTTITQYSNIWGNGWAGGAALSPRSALIATGGNFTKLSVVSNTSPGSGKSYALSFRLNNTSDSLTATISDANTTATATGSQAVTGGDFATTKCVPTGIPNAVVLGWCYTFEPTTNGENIYGYGTGDNPGASTLYEQPLGSGAGTWNATESNRLLRIPGLDSKKLYVALSVAPGGVTSRTFTWRDNNTGSALTVTITGAATTGNDTAHTVAHIENQSVSMEHSVSGAPASSDVHFGYVLATSQPVEKSYASVY